MTYCRCSLMEEVYLKCEASRDEQGVTLLFAQSCYQAPALSSSATTLTLKRSGTMIFFFTFISKAL